MGKNIVILSDGTGQEGGIGHNTNVYKLFNIIEDRTERQMIFYDPGIGTRGFITRKITGLIGGKGITKNIFDCYSYLFQNYQAGDDIYLIGFSRGAATVRSLASFIHHFGILPRSRPELIDRAYRIYRIGDEQKMADRAKAFIRKHHTMWARIKFLGCYDTVSALGLPSKYLSTLLNILPGFRHKFHNFSLSESVENAYHALAIDDKRQTFHPVLWDSECREYQKIRQVWFAGMHTDVGGGYRECQLSDIPLVWLTDKAVENGLHIYDRERIDIDEDPAGHMHDSRGTLLTKLYRKKKRFWPSDRSDNPVIHASVLERSRRIDSYRPWILDEDYQVEPWINIEEQDW